MNKNNVWFITPKTNLHVGNENTSSYGLIDLAVQRNATSNLPCINSSSLKGALNEYAAKKVCMYSKSLIKIFGSDKVKENGKARNTDTQKGLYTFFDANILLLPVQDDKNLYHLVTSAEVLNMFRNQLALFGIKINSDNNALKDELKSTLKINTSIEIIDNKKFSDLCSDDNLPIIARNVLENGESKNLWYEQVVPAETVFYTIIDGGNDDSLSKKLGEDIVQIGANATIGYGYCKFTNLN